MSPITMQITETVKDSGVVTAQSESEILTQLPEAIHQWPHKLRVLLIEDSASDSELMLHALKRAGFGSEAEVVDSAEEFRDRIRRNKYDIILADYSLPGWNGMETVAILRQEGLDVPVVLVSGALGELKAVECIKQGAADYVLKDHLARLPESVRRAIG